MTDTTRSCLISLKRALAGVGFVIPNPDKETIDDATALAAQLVTNGQVAQALRGGSGLGEEAQQLAACAAVKTALSVRTAAGQLPPLVAQQAQALAPPPPPPPPSGPSADTTKVITYAAIGVLGVAFVGGLVIALRRGGGRRRRY